MYKVNFENNTCKFKNNSELEKKARQANGKRN